MDANRGIPKPYGDPAPTDGTDVIRERVISERLFQVKKIS
jgi:hypothetical protein